MEKLMPGMRAFISHKIAEGFDSADRIIDQAVALFANNEAYCPSYWDFRGGDDSIHPETTVRPPIERIAAELLDERRRLESAWTEPTDCDRLDQAFAALERDGIVAGQNLLCCMTCARAEIGVRIGQKINSGHVVRGCVYYHEQDTARVPYGHLLLAFASTVNDNEHTVRIGRSIVDALSNARLQSEWKDDPNTRIVLHLDWRKRRFSSAPPCN